MEANYFEIRKGVLKMKRFKVWGYSGNPCNYKMVWKIVIAENRDNAIRKSRIRNVTQIEEV